MSWLRTADGPPRPARPDRRPTPRVPSRRMYAESHDRLHAPPDPQQLSEAGLTGPQGGPWLLHVGRQGSFRRGADALKPLSDTRGGSRPHRPLRRRRGLGDDGLRDRRGVREGRIRGGARGPQRGRRRRRPSSRIGSRSGGSADKGRIPRRTRGGARAHLPAVLTTRSPTSDVALEASRGPRREAAAVSRRSTRSAKPGERSRDHDLLLPVVACARATSRPQDVIGMHFFNRRRHEAGRVVRRLLTSDEVHATRS